MVLAPPDSSVSLPVSPAPRGQKPTNRHGVPFFPPSFLLPFFSPLQKKCCEDFGPYKLNFAHISHTTKNNLFLQLSKQNLSIQNKPTSVSRESADWPGLVRSKFWICFRINNAGSGHAADWLRIGAAPPSVGNLIGSYLVPISKMPINPCFF